MFATVSLTFAMLSKPTALPIDYTVIPRVELWSFSSTGAQDPTTPTPNNLVAGVWSSGTTYGVGAYVVPTSFVNNGYYFRAISGGVSGGSQPAWPSTPGVNVVDGGLTWTCVGRNGTMPQLNRNIDSLFNAGQPQTLFLDFDPTGSNVTAVASHRYVAEAFNVAPPVVPGAPGFSTFNLRVLGINLSLNNITTMRFP